MSGWNILYGLINFVILAGGLFLVGRKIVRNMLEKHRDEVQKGLEDSEQAAENAGKLLQELPEKDARGREAVARIAEDATPLTLTNFPVSLPPLICPASDSDSTDGPDKYTLWFYPYYTYKELMKKGKQQLMEMQ